MAKRTKDYPPMKPVRPTVDVEQYHNEKTTNKTTNDTNSKTTSKTKTIDVNDKSLHKLLKTTNRTKGSTTSKTTNKTKQHTKVYGDKKLLMPLIDNIKNAFGITSDSEAYKFALRFIQAYIK